MLTKLIRDRRGAGMVEYIILVGLVAILAMAAFRTFGNSVTHVASTQAATIGTVQATEGSSSPQ